MPGLTPEGLKGKVKWLEVTNGEGQPCLRVRGNMELSGTGMSLPGAPPAVKVTEFAGTMAMESDFPVDPNALVSRTDADLKMRMAAAGEVEKDGRRMRIEMKAEFASRTKEQAKRME